MALKRYIFSYFIICLLLSITSCSTEFEKIRTSNDPELILKKAHEYFKEGDNYNAQALYELYIENLDAHTTYFNLLVDTGIIGFVLFLIYLVTMFKISFKSLKLSVTEDEKSMSIILNIYCFSLSLIPGSHF